jgi:hypothetical protein
MILTGKKGKKLFDEIYHGPKVPYERLKKESEVIKKQWKAALEK